MRVNKVSCFVRWLPSGRFFTASALAALTSGFLGAPLAQAQGSVTLYGVVDSGYGYENFQYKYDNKRLKSRHSGLNDGYLKSSRWGLKGSEPLSDGLYAIFQLEQGFALNTGMAKDGYAFSRKALVGLRSDTFGVFTAGRQKTVGDDFIDVDATKGMGEAENAFGAVGVRTSNVLKYISPTWSGFTAGVAYATDGGFVKDKTTGIERLGDRDYLLSAGVHYQNGPLTLAAVHDWQQANKSDGQRLGYRVRNWMAAASYDFDAFTVNIAYGQDHNGKLKSPGYVSGSTFDAPVSGLGSYNSQGFKSRNYLISVSMPLGGGQLGLAWTRSSSNLSDVYADHHPGQRLATKTQTIYAAMYTYKLSKRTTLYGYGSYGTGLAYIDQIKGGEAGFGLNHQF